MNKRRLMIWLIVVVSALGLAACGGVGGEESTGENDNEGTADVEGAGDNEEGGTVEEEDTSDVIADEEVFEEDVKGNEDDQLEALGGGYIYRREGGIAGFCDVVTVLTGTATVATCATDPPEIAGEVTLSAEQAQLVTTWIESLATFKDKQEDAATADAMTITITFVGQGDGEATEEDIAAMQALAMEVLRMATNPTE